MTVADCLLDRDPGESPRGVLVAGASGGIGRALCRELATRFPEVDLVRMARRPDALESLPVACVDIGLELGDEAAIARAVAAVPSDFPLDWVLLATGWLHDAQHMPEKSFRTLDADHLLRAYSINAVGPALLIKHLLLRLESTRGSRIGVLSARVGSISDNRLGGWHSYRASKAALNMLIRNYAIELGRRDGRFVIVGLQPGTTDTALSAPFQRNVPPQQLQTPAFTAQRLVAVMQRLCPQDSGRLFDFDGLTFDP